MLVAGVVAVVAVALGTTIGVVLGTGGDDPPRPAAAPVARTTSAASTAPTAAAPAASTVITPTTAVASATPTTAASQAYSGPGGLAVRGPVGWVPDASAGVASVADFRAPTSTKRLLGPTFRIGIGNDDPGTDFDDEVAQSAAFLQSEYAATVLATTRTPFLGVTAADIEYTYFNTELGVQRHGRERLWRHGAVTMIIQSSDVDSDWTAGAAVFRELVASASLS